MVSFIFKRILMAVPTLLILIFISFVLMHAAPGGSFTTERALPPQVLANIEARYGLNDPLYLQIWNYLVGILTEFDFGPSFKYKNQTVNDVIGQGFPVTLTYGSIAFVFAMVIGTLLGTIAAMRQNSLVDYFAIGLSIVAQVLPTFVLAPILVLVFTLWLRWLPGGGWNGGQWPYLVMPVIALATSHMASVARIMRSSMLEVLRSQFIRTARAKGLPDHVIIIQHALKPALLPLLSYMGPAFVAMITGSVVIDLYFATGGIGQSFVQSALSRDYSVMMGITILIGALTVAFNLIVDILYTWIDPKIEY